MLNKEYSIDFELIWKKIHSSLSEKEEEEFNSWLEKDEERREYYEKAKRYYTEGSGLNQDPDRIRESWNSITHKITQIEQQKRNERQKKNRNLIYASVLFTCIAISAGIIFLRPDHVEPIESAVLEKSIEPGISKAVLILDDGSTFDLSQEKNLAIRDGGTLINSSGDGLKYVEQDSSPPEIKYNTLSIPRGGEFFLTLSDGTKVWLNSQSILKYPVQFAGKERSVELTGEAYFEVYKNKSIPFKVITGEQVLEVLGTSFNLSSYPDEKYIYTTLVEGEVNVFLMANPEISQKLKPSMQSSFQKGSLNISRNNVKVDEFIAWKEGRFSFYNQDLSEMMKTVSRWYDLDVSFENQEARDIKFTGQVRRYENFEKILSLIEKTNEVRFEINEKTVIVR